MFTKLIIILENIKELFCSKLCFWQIEYISQAHSFVFSLLNILAHFNTAEVESCYYYQKMQVYNKVNICILISICNYTCYKHFTYFFSL